MAIEPAKAPGEEKGWEDLLQLDSKDVCKRSLATYDEKFSRYMLKIFTTDYNVMLREKAIRPADEKRSFLPEFGTDFRIMVLDYLVNSKEIPVTGRLVSGAQLKAGEFFFRGTHGLELDVLVKAFGNEPERFKEAGISLGGKVMGMGDVSIQLQVLPRVPITYVLWASDEEFPARMSVLFDSTADSHLHLDTLRTAVTTTNKTLLAVKER